MSILFNLSKHCDFRQACREDVLFCRAPERSWILVFAGDLDSAHRDYASDSFSSCMIF